MACPCSRDCSRPCFLEKWTLHFIPYGMKGLTIGVMPAFSTKQYGHILTGGQPDLVEGLIEEDLGECTLTVKWLVVVNRVLDMTR